MCYLLFHCESFASCEVCAVQCVRMSRVKVETDTDYLRRNAGKQLKDALISYESGDVDSDLQMQLKYYVRLPDPATHINHVLQEVHLML